MPQQDKTGPMGMGPATGRGMGICGGGKGMGYTRKISCNGRDLGWRRFWGYCHNPEVSKKEELEILSEEAVALEDELKNVKNRLEEIKNQK